MGTHGCTGIPCTICRSTSDPKFLVSELLRVVSTWYTFSPPDNGYGLEDVQYAEDILKAAKEFSEA